MKADRHSATGGVLVSFILRPIEIGEKILRNRPGITSRRARFSEVVGTRRVPVTGDPTRRMPTTKTRSTSQTGKLFPTRSSVLIDPVDGVVTPRHLADHARSVVVVAHGGVSHRRKGGEVGV